MEHVFFSPLLYVFFTDNALDQSKKKAIGSASHLDLARRNGVHASTNLEFNELATFRLTWPSILAPINVRVYDVIFANRNGVHRFRGQKTGSKGELAKGVNV